MCENRFFLFFLAFVFNSSCTTLKTFRYNFADVDDYKIFENRELIGGKDDFNFKRNIIQGLGDQILINPKKDRKKKDTLQSLNTYVDQSFPLAFMIIKDDKIIYERYKKDYSAKTLYPSFSMIKSLGIFPLIGIAIKEGKIKNFDDKLSNYLDDLHPKLNKEITIRHLTNMNSGIKETGLSLSPFTTSVVHYYTNNLNKQTAKLKSKQEPGEDYFYSASSSSLLLGTVLEKVYNQPLEELLEEKILSKIGASEKSLWSMDQKEGRVKPFCCFHGSIDTYARLIRLIQKKGQWQDQQVIPEEWINEIFNSQNNMSATDHRVQSGESKFYYSAHWYRNVKNPQVIKAAGFLTQQLMIFPEKNILLLTFSDLKGWQYNFNHSDIYFEIIEQL